MTPELSALTGGTPPQGGKRDGNPFAAPSSRVGLYMTDDHRYYVNGEGPIPSVTTALRVIDKPAVSEWLQNQTAQAAMLHLPELIGLAVEDGVKLIRSYPRATVDSAAKLGSMVHYLADMAPRASEIDSKGFEMPPEVFPYLEAFRGFLGFLEAQGGQIVSSEKAVWSKTEGYAGTYDLIIRLKQATWLCDIKTSRYAYADFGLQLAAYRGAEYIVLPDDPTLYPMPQIDKTAILHLRPDQYPGPMQAGWRLIEYPTTDRDYVAFLAALDLYRWRQEGRFTKKILETTTYKPIEKGI